MLSSSLEPHGTTIAENEEGRLAYPIEMSKAGKGHPSPASPVSRTSSVRLILLFATGFSAGLG